MEKFEKNFMIGAATAAHQVEGNNVNSDFWVMENVPGSTYKEPSLDAVDHYNRYREDIKMLADAGLTAYRFSIEWARIEPSKGSFDRNEIEHYREVLNCCHEHGVTPVVSLHHFSSPKWLISEGGWESETTIEFFGNYCKYVVSELGELIPYICTINEANMGLQIARIVKEYMSKMEKTSESKPVSANSDVQVGINLDTQDSREKYYRSLGDIFGIDYKDVHPYLEPRTKNGDIIVMKCHENARRVIKSLNPNIKVGVTMSLYDYQAIPGGEEYVKEMWDEDFEHYLPYIKEDDFFGVQNYTRKVFGPNGKINPSKNTRMTEAGNEFYPESLAGVLRYVSKHWKKPIIVTENGISTSNDKDRVEFIEGVMGGLYQCIEEGIDVIGYMHWTLLDNFEWQRGYDQKFGLIAVDRTTQTRYPKESLIVLGSIKKIGF
ncbi:glycoside hydrolase family 1 [Clostridium beijerinckii]|uniref:Glycoside hydrolase family 1 n=1 Tax=Clostridium beijerinckii TaxID=1520 RepID=A0A0B5Q7U6_CLOBE|nr:family 1 glycosylhydrolase [Clostridium beijerinckii]AJG98209.1 glycoside hydrolase family 1 [Clostridium beijerinckii]